MSSAIKVPTIFTAVDKFSDVINKMTGNVGKFNKQAAGMERFNNKLNKFKVHALAGGAALGLTIKQANDFQSSMSNVSTLLDTNVENMDKMGKEVLAISKKLPVPVDELTSSLYDIRSAGISASKAMGALETAGKLSVAGLATTSEATNILTSAMNAFASEGLSSEQIANILFKTVKAGKTDIAQLSQAFGANAAIIQASGVKLMDYQSATAALTLSGTPAAQAQNQIKAAMVQLQKPTADMAKIFKKLGVTTVNELINREGSMVGAFDAIGNAGNKMRVNLAKAWSSSEALAAVNSLTGSAKESYIGTLKDMAGGGDVLTEAFNKQAKTQANQLKIAQNNIQSLSITVGTVLAPMVTTLVNSFQPLISGISEFIQRNNWILNIIPGVIALFVGFKYVLWATRAAIFANNIAMGISAARVGAMSLAMKGNLVAQNAYKIATVIGTAVTWLANSAFITLAASILAATWPILAVIAAVAAIVAIFYYWDDIVAWFSKQWENFTGWISELWGKVVNWFKEFDFMAFFKRIGQSILSFMLLPMKGVLTLLSKIPGKVGELAQLGLDKIADITGTVEADVKDGTLPAPETEQAKITRENNANVKGKIDVNIRDKGNNVESTDTEGSGIPIKVTPTQGAY